MALLSVECPVMLPLLGQSERERRAILLGAKKVASLCYYPKGHLVVTRDEKSLLSLLCLLDLLTNKH